MVLRELNQIQNPFKTELCASILAQAHEAGLNNYINKISNIYCAWPCGKAIYIPFNFYNSSI